MPSGTQSRCFAFGPKRQNFKLKGWFPFSGTPDPELHPPSVQANHCPPRLPLVQDGPEQGTQHQDIIIPSVTCAPSDQL